MWYERVRMDVRVGPRRRGHMCTGVVVCCWDLKDYKWSPTQTSYRERREQFPFFSFFLPSIQRKTKFPMSKWIIASNKLLRTVFLLHSVGGGQSFGNNCLFVHLVCLEARTPRGSDPLRWSCLRQIVFSVPGSRHNSLCRLECGRRVE